MLRASADTIARVTDGEVLFGSGNAYATGVSTDSRECGSGCAFIALTGERSDGNDHAIEALRAGARVLVLSRGREHLTSQITEALSRGAAIVGVGDGRRALTELATWHRTRLLCAVVGVTGSTGKTTTKDFIRAALATTMRVVSTQGNRNNEIGVPLTVLSAGTQTDALIVEMGMRGAGQIAQLCEVARPTMGLVTNVGTSHIELLGSLDAIAGAKGELAAAVPADGMVFLNGDDVHSEALASRAVAPVNHYGLSDRCEVRAADVELDEMSRPSFMLITHQGSVSVTLPTPGRHNVYNALAAAAVALRLAVPLEAIAVGLGEAEMSGMRMDAIAAASGVTILNDAYNANPASMRAALQTLADMTPKGRRIAVLGDMAELGTLTDLSHLEIGEYVTSRGIDVLVTVGTRARRIAEGARISGMDRDLVRPCATPEEAVEVLDDLAESGDVVLVKASRVMGLEKVVEGLVDPRVG